jgi:hypothetical protein
MDECARPRPAGPWLRWHEYSITSREDEERDLNEAIALYQKVCGQRPLGWNCRSFPSVNTRDLLVREGDFLYHSDPCNDDLPYFIDHAGTRILVVPYSKTLNDSRYLIAPGYSNPRDFAEDCRSAINYMLSEADETGGRMLTIGLHARWSGQPNRASGVRDLIEHVLNTPGAGFMRRLDIARFWLANNQSLAREPDGGNDVRDTDQRRDPRQRRGGAQSGSGHCRRPHRRHPAARREG